MIRFAVGCGLVAIAICSWCATGGAAMPQWYWYGPDALVGLELSGPMASATVMALLMLGPTVVGGAMLGATAVNAISPRRVFHPHVEHGRGVWAIVLGIIAGVLTYAVASLVLMYPSESEMIQTLMMAGVGCAMGGLVVMTTARYRAGTCRGCGYDLSAMTVSGGGRCPECGADQFKIANVQIANGKSEVR
jgi:hypothetical protein